MKTKILPVSIIALFAMVANIHALTFADIAGVYDCKRTEKYSDHTARYDQVLVIRPDGYIINIATLPGGQTVTLEGFAEIDQDGNLINAGGVSGQFKGNGKHIEAIFVWPPDLYPGGVTITIRGQQTGD